jgi:signal transduction histidine kinase
MAGHDRRVTSVWQRGFEVGRFLGLSEGLSSSSVIQQPVMPHAAAPVAGVELPLPAGLRRVLWVARIIVVAVHMTAAGFIGRDLLEDDRPRQAAAILAVSVLACLWSLVHLRPGLQDYWLSEAQSKPMTDSRKVWMIGVGLVLALICLHLARGHNPHALHSWFFFPCIGASLSLNRNWIWLSIGIVLATSSMVVWMDSGPSWVMNWLLTRLLESSFIVTCLLTAKIAARQRQQMEKQAGELHALNAQLELQADQATMLAVAQERNRLAREIHDSVGHSLTVVGAQLDAAEALLRQSPERALEAIRKAQRSSREGLGDIRRSVSTLHAVPKDERTLGESITALIADVERPGLKLRLELEGRTRPLPSLVQISLYRCAQEGITNACRHSCATEITVRLDFAATSSVSLSVCDNGKGFRKEATGGLGLKGLRERAALLHGEFTAGNTPQGGGLCRMIIPA